MSPGQLSSNAPLRLRILHLSDLHERGPREREHWRRRRVLGDAWERNLDEIMEGGAIDLVCFTGDVADWGVAGEYDAATAFFERLLSRLGLGAERLFVVPGNHDIMRPVEEDAWKALRGALARGLDPLSLSRWMAGLDRAPPLGVEDNVRERLLKRQDAYRAWVRGALGRPELDPAGSPHGRLGYRRTLILGDEASPVHIIGLDTAWLAGDDADAGKLRLTEDQVMRLATGARGEPLAGLRIALMHHPFSDLADGAQARRLLADHADVVLRGHLHATEMSTWSDPDRRTAEFAVGCLYEGHAADQWPNAVQVLTIRQKEEKVAGTSWFRAWSDRGHWHDDSSLYRGSKGGELAWEIARERRRGEPGPGAGRAQAPEAAPWKNPYDVQAPATPPRFAGRAGLLQDLETALETRRSVSIVGDFRIGKTSALRTWEQRASAAGRVVRYVSGEDASGHSPGAFVRAITGLDAPDDADGSANALDRWTLGAAHKDLPPLVLVDEADDILKRFDDRFFQRLRGMVGRKAIALVLSSWQEIDAIYEGLQRTSPFYNLLETLWVALLEPEAADQVIGWGERVWIPGDEELLRAWAGRHPFYLQLFGHHLARARQAGKGAEAGLERFRDQAERHLRDLWRALGERDQEDLRACVKGGVAARRRSLRRRGAVTEERKPFGRVLAEWVKEEK
ncbi:metallophosphoesterase [Sorangium sp. So ce429]